MLTIAKAQKSKSPTAKANAQSVVNLKLEAKLDSIFLSFNKNTPGITVTIIQNGKVLAKKAYGRRAGISPDFHYAWSRLTLS